MAPFTDLSSKRLAPRYRRGRPQLTQKFFRPLPLNTTPPTVAAKAAAGSRICARYRAGRNFFQSRGFPATLPTPRHAYCSNSGTSCARTDEAFVPNVCRSKSGDFAAVTALSSSALPRRLPSQSEIHSGAFWRCNPVGSIPERKLVRSVPHSKGFFHRAGCFSSWRGCAQCAVNARQIAANGRFDA